jgi:hypothetical protein
MISILQTKSTLLDQISAIQRTFEPFRFSPNSSSQQLSTAEGLIKMESSLCGLDEKLDPSFRWDDE